MLRPQSRHRVSKDDDVATKWNRRPKCAAYAGQTKTVRRLARNDQIARLECGQHGGTRDPVRSDHARPNEERRQHDASQSWRKPEPSSPRTFALARSLMFDGEKAAARNPKVPIPNDEREHDEEARRDRYRVFVGGQGKPLRPATLRFPP